MRRAAWLRRRSGWRWWRWSISGRKKGRDFSFLCLCGKIERCRIDCAPSSAVAQRLPAQRLPAALEKAFREPAVHNSGLEAGVISSLIAFPRPCLALQPRREKDESAGESAGESPELPTAQARARARALGRPAVRGGSDFPIGLAGRARRGRPIGQPASPRGQNQRPSQSPVVPVTMLLNFGNANSGRPAGLLRPWQLWGRREGSEREILSARHQLEPPDFGLG